MAIYTSSWVEKCTAWKRFHFSVKMVYQNANAREIVNLYASEVRLGLQMSSLVL